MTVVTNRFLSGQKRAPYNTIRAPRWINVTETQPSINGWTFAKQLPARAGCLQRDEADANWFRFEVAPGDICVAVDGGGAAVERCELSSVNTLSLNTAYTFRYEMKIYTPGVKDAGSDGWIVIGQLHQTPDAQDAGVSPLYAREIIASPRAIAYNQRQSEVDPVVSNPTSNYIYTSATPTSDWDRWITVVEEHKISPSSTAGYHRVYHDGVQVANYSGKTGYVDAVGPYLKFGIYRDIDLTNTNVVEFRGFMQT